MNFDSIFWLHDKKIHVLTSVESFEDSKIELAYYLYIDGVHVETKWYSKDRHAMFKTLVDECFDFKVLVFLKSGNEKWKKYAEKSNFFGTIVSDGFLLATSKVLCKFPLHLFFGENGECVGCDSEIDGSELLWYLEKYKLVKTTSDLCFVKLSRDTCGVQSVSLKVKVGEQFYSVPWSNSRMSLEILETPGLKEFSEIFTYASKRHYSAHVALVIAKNNFENVFAPDRVRVNSAVIYTYKCLELEGNIDDCLDMLSSGRALLDLRKTAFGVRRDPIQLLLSLSMAEIHVLLKIGFHLEVINKVDYLVSVFESAEFKGYYSLNYSKSLAIGIAASWYLGLEAKCKNFSEKISGLRVLIDDWFHQGKKGWLVTERAHVERLINMVEDSGDIATCSGAVIQQLIGEAVRVKSDEYLKKVIPYDDA
jgi:hypothetical protein